MRWLLDLLFGAGGRRAPEAPSPEAITAARNRASICTREGFLEEAVDAWHEVSRLDPNAIDPYVGLADLYVRLGRLVDAKASLVFAVEEHIKRGQVDEAGRGLRRIADIDPTDLKVRSMLADLAMRNGDLELSVAEHIAIAKVLGEQGHLAEAGMVLEKALRMDPENPQVRAELDKVRGVH